MEIQILYEDADVVAVNKPAGLVVHSDGRTTEPTLADWVLRTYPETIGVGEPNRTEKGETVLRPGIVHRLDRETSGVMLVAKTVAGFDALKSQFQDHAIEKIYHAFVCGEMKTKKGTIDRPIGRSTKDFRMWSAQRGARGEMREAVTDYVVAGIGHGYSLVHAMPRTGRTHQIRVHFKAISYPLVADSLYAPGRENTLGFTRLALHSSQITFTDRRGQKQTVSAPYPEDFERAVAKFEDVLQS